MSKLNSNALFSEARSTVSVDRSCFDLSHGHHQTMNAGLLYPHFIKEVLPGDTFNFSASFVNRMSTPIVPIMDTAFLDQWYFYVPKRLVWEHTKEFYGENNVSAWDETREYYIPVLNPGVDGFKADGVADNFGIPTSASGLAVNALPFRAYRLIWNEWFRDQNTQDPKLVNFGDSESDMTLDELLPVNKRRDYFTTCLPEPQKGPDILLPLGSYAPVLTRPETTITGLDTELLSVPLRGFATDTYLGFADSFSALVIENKVNEQSSSGSNVIAVSSDLSNNYNGDSYGFYPSNLWADLSNSQGATVNALRQAFAIQSLFELDARGGSRYREFLKAHFGVNVPDLTVQIPEFLGGSSDPIQVNQVIQTSASDHESPLGNTAAFSKTVGRNQGAFTKSFSEPGYVIGVCAIRTLHSYQDGLDRMWSRRSRLDFYHPVLAHIGETPVYNKEIYVYNYAERDKVFGYQEAWAEYRFAQSYSSGAFRSNYPDGSLDRWTYVDDFSSLPHLSDEFIRETDDNVARTLATTDMPGAPQFITDWWFNLKAYRPLPAYGTPAVLGGRQ